MSRQRMRRDDVIVEILQRWGDWRKTLSEFQGWGGAEAERMPGAPGAHSDPVLAEYLRTHQQGNGLFHFVDTSVREFHIPHQKIIVYRYVRGETFTRIADQLATEEHIIRSMHNSCRDVLAKGMIAYVLAGRDREATDAYWRDIKAVGSASV